MQQKNETIQIQQITKQKPPCLNIDEQCEQTLSCKYLNKETFECESNKPFACLR